MPHHVDKLVVTHRGALRSKYGAAGYGAVRAALRELAAADKDRGLSSRLVLLDDERTMKPFGGTPVTDPGDAVAAKNAVDAAATALTSHYILLLGSPDVVPQQRLRNPTPDDDPDVPSDLPYACAAPPAADPGDFVGPTRVVGRLPDLPGASEPSFLLTLIGNACGWTSRAASAHLPVFAVSARVWQGSSEESIRQLAGAGNEIHLTPAEGPGWERRLTRRRMHFVNCHGDEADFRWYGDDGNTQPVALDGMLLRDGLTRDCVVAAECCFGAAHYDPALSGQQTLAQTYLREGASGLFGASTLAYGDADRTTSADLITRFFLSAVLEGASLGRAVLQSRLRFVQELGELDPYDLKTLVQFDFLGDPSAQPVTTAVAPEGVAAARVSARRTALAALGGALGSSVPRAVLESRRSPRSRERLAAELGFTAPPQATVRRYDVRSPAAVGAAPGRVTFTVLAGRPDDRRREAVIVRSEVGRPSTYRTVHSR